MQCIHSRRLQHTTYSKGQINQRGTEQHIRTEMYRTLYPKSSRIHILLKCTWNILKNRSYIIWHKEPQEIQKDWNCTNQLLRPQRYETRNELCKENKKPTNTWRLNNMLLNNQWIDDQIQRSSNLWRQMKTVTQHHKNLWDTEKVMLRGKYIAIQAYLRKKEQSHMNSLNSKLMKLEKEQMRPKVRGVS